MIEFLLARLAEDEAALETARRMGVPALPGGSRIWSGIGNHPTVSETRLAAEIEAKRAIVNSYAEEKTRRDIYQRDEVMLNEEEQHRRRSSAARCRGLEIAVENLASVYADHPDWREEWKA